MLSLLLQTSLSPTHKRLSCQLLYAARLYFCTPSLIPRSPGLACHPHDGRTAHARHCLRWHVTKFPTTPGPSAFPLKMPALNSQTLETFYAEELVSTPPHSPNILGLPQKLIRGSAQPRAFQPEACPSVTHHTPQPLQTEEESRP